MYAIFYAEGAGTEQETFHWFVDGLLREFEGPEVHRDHVLRPHFNKTAQGIFRAGVHGAEAIRVVGSDGKQRDFGTETLADLGEAAEVGSVSRVIDRVAAVVEHVSAIAAMHIANDPCAP